MPHGALALFFADVELLKRDERAQLCFGIANQRDDERIARWQTGRHNDVELIQPGSRQPGERDGRRHSFNRNGRLDREKQGLADHLSIGSRRIGGSKTRAVEGDGFVSSGSGRCSDSRRTDQTPIRVCCG